MAALSAREVASKCLGKSGVVSLKKDIFDLHNVQPPKSLKKALEFIQEFRCPPRKPTNLEITAVGKESISLAWQRNSDNEDGFEVVWMGRRDASQHKDGSRETGPNRNSLTLDKLFPRPGYEYCFRIRAFNKGGHSDFSNQACATIPNDSPQPQQGFSEVSLYNCHDKKRTIHFWMRDITTGSGWSEKGSLSSQYSNSGLCPAPGASPLVITFPDTHLYEIVAVDPDADNCGKENNPNKPSCLRMDALRFFGKPDGSPVLQPISIR